MCGRYGLALREYTPLRSACVHLATPIDRCAQVALRALAGGRPATELEVVEVGCGAGGASFELSKVAGECDCVVPVRA